MTHLLGLAAKKLKCPKPTLARAHIVTLQNYDWPGNIRELQNVLERAAITARHDGVVKLDLIGFKRSDGSLQLDTATENSENARVLTEAEMQRRERDNLLAALQQTSWKIYGPGGAAELLGVKAQTIVSRIQKLKLKKPES